jgi:hypothetical protein
MLDPAPLVDALDLWACMWEPVERERFELALVQTLAGDHPHALKLHALILCHVLGTPRLCDAAADAADSGLFSAEELKTVEADTLPWYRLVSAADHLRGNVRGVELLLKRVVNGPAPDADQLLDWVDLRDLVAVARTTLDARLYAEVVRRVATRGRYQQARAANLLDFEVRQSAAP